MFTVWTKIQAPHPLCRNAKDSPIRPKESLVYNPKLQNSYRKRACIDPADDGGRLFVKGAKREPLMWVARRRALGGRIWSSQRQGGWKGRWGKAGEGYSTTLVLDV